MWCAYQFSAEFSKTSTNLCKLRERKLRMRTQLEKRGTEPRHTWHWTDTILRLTRPDSRFTKQMSQLCFILPAPSFERHPSLGPFPLGPFASRTRSTVLMALLAYKLAEERQNDGQTDKRTRRDKGLGGKGVVGRKNKAHYFTGARTRRIMGGRERCRGWQRTEGTTRGGVVGCGQIC